VKKFFILLIFLFTQKSFAVLNGEELLSYFQANCQGQGQFTKKSLSDARGLVSVLENLRDDPDCHGVFSQAGRISNIESYLNEINNVSENALELEKLKAQANELIILLGSNEDPIFEEVIKETLYENQTSQVLIEGILTVEDKYGPKNLSKSLTEILSLANSLGMAVGTSVACLEKYPSIIPAATTLLSSMGSMATNFGPVWGLGLSAGADLFNALITTSRNARFNRIIKKLSDQSLNLEGFRCAMESLTNRWCELEDAKELLEMKVASREVKRSQDKIPLELIDRYMPAFFNWLSKIRAGVAPATNADSDRQERVIIREAMVRAARSQGAGIISEYTSLYDSTPSDKEKYFTLKQVIAKLVGLGCSDESETTSSFSNPLLNIYNKKLAPYYLMGLSEVPRDSGFQLYFCNFDPFTQWPEEDNYSPSLTLVKDRYFSWVDQAEEMVTREMNQVLLPDPLILLMAAFDQSANKWKISAKDAIDKILLFLINDENKILKSPPRMATLYHEMKSDLIKIRNILNSDMETLTKENAKDALNRIYQIAKLNYGTVIFQSRLDFITRQAIFRYINESGGEDYFSAQLLAMDNFVDQLKTISGTDNLTTIMGDILRARPIALHNMIVFSEVFAKPLGIIIKDIYQDINKSSDLLIKETLNGHLADLCLLVSSLPSWPKKIKKEYCIGTQVKSVFLTGPSAKKITKKLLSSDFNNRQCGFRDHQRKSKIFQDW
jgi:hypothetical protein